jgi:hypothetical protein
MSGTNLDTFDEFIKRINENHRSLQFNGSFASTSGSSGEVEEDKAKWDNSGGKIQTQNQKIRIVLGVPDSQQGEQVRYEFKFVNSEDLDPATAKQKALGGISGLLKDQVSKKVLTSNMVGFIETKRDNKRLIGDYLFKGVISFYDQSRFKNLGNTAIKPIMEIPVPATGDTQTQLASKMEVPVVSKVIEANATPPANIIRIYEFTAMKDLSDPGNAPQVDANTLLAMVQTRVAEPAQSPIQQVNIQSGQSSSGSSGSAGSSGSSGVSGVNGTSGSSGDASSVSYEGLTKNLTVNPIVKELQARIIVKGATDPIVKPAADLLNAIGKADGKYGDNTAKAIAQIVTGNQQSPITTIDKATSDKLNSVLTNIDPGAVSKYTTAQTTQVASKAVKTANTQVKGQTLYF